MAAKKDQAPPADVAMVEFAEMVTMAIRSQCGNNFGGEDEPRRRFRNLCDAMGFDYEAFVAERDGTPNPLLNKGEAISAAKAAEADRNAAAKAGPQGGAKGGDGDKKGK